MNFAKTILLLVFTAVVMAFYCHEPPAPGAARTGLKTPAKATGKLTLSADAAGKNMGTLLLKKSFAPDGVFIKTATRLVHAGRNEGVSFRDGFFVSLISYCPLSSLGAPKSFSPLHFEPQQQKIIFPYHHFW